jgi:hypothetical protein
MGVTDCYAASMKRSLSALALCLLACGPRDDDGSSTTFGITLTLGETGIGDGDGDPGDGDGDSGDGDGDGEPGDGDPGDGDGDDTAGPKFDTVAEVDIMSMDCINCVITIDSMQSGVFEVNGNNIFATATLQNEIVYALGTYGSGRFIASADSSLPFNEITDCPLRAWLAGTESVPAIFWFGWTDSDGPSSFNVAATEGGVHLPPQYIGNPAQLAADYDIVMYLEASGQFDGGDEPSDAEMQTLLDYVQLHGGGLYAVSEFADPNFGAYLNQNDLDSVNRLMQPLGITALQVSLNWGNVDGNIDFECFPQPEG